MDIKMVYGIGLAIVVTVILLFSACNAETLSKHRPKASPFEIKDGLIGDLHTKILSNTNTGEYAEIVVDFGGRVEELVLVSQSAGRGTSSAKPQKILLSHNGNATAIKENAWFKGMLLVPWANRIAYGKYRFFNTTYQLPLNENTTSPMRQNNLHGLLVGKVLQVKSATTNQSGAVLTLSYDFKNEDDGYPFAWKYEATYTLSSKGLDISILVQNPTPKEPLPMYIGWHPYFLCTTYKAVITFDTCTGWNHVEVNSNMDPTGITSPGTPFDGTTPIGGSAGKPTAYDDGYKATRPPSMCGQLKTKLYDPDTDKTVVLYQSENMRFLQVFTGIDGSVAIEPMSGMADAFNNHDHLTILSGGEVFQESFGVYLE